MMLKNKVYNFDDRDIVDDPNILVSKAMGLEEGIGSIALTGYGTVVAVNGIKGGWKAAWDIVKGTGCAIGSNITWAVKSDANLQQEYLAKFPWLSKLPPQEREAKLKEIIEGAHARYWNTLDTAVKTYNYSEQYTEEERKAMEANMGFAEKLLNLGGKFYDKISSSLFYGVAALFIMGATAVVVIALTNGRFGRFVKLISDIIAEFIDALKKIAYSFVHSIVTVSPNMFSDIINIIEKFKGRAIDIFKTIKEEGFLSSLITICVSCVTLAIICIFGLISFIVDNKNSGTKYISGGFM